MKRGLFSKFAVFFLLLIIGIGGWYLLKDNRFDFLSFLFKSQKIISPSSFMEWTLTPTQLPLLKYTIENLGQRSYQTNPLSIISFEETQPLFDSYLFSYQTLNKKVSGWLNIPHSCQNQTCPTVILVRGYATPENYYSGYGTKRAAAVFAQNGYITLSPDFLGFGQSDPEPTDPWEARFVKPINVIELLFSLEKFPYLSSSSVPTNHKSIEASKNEIASQSTDNNAEPTMSVNTQIDTTQIFFWAHSNGGQIVLSVLEALSKPIPSSLWAPVSAPFPYSILFFTRTDVDEGKEARAWLAMFEREYDVLDFSATQHLNRLTAPIQIHHGTQDQDALWVWSQSLCEMIELENKTRHEEQSDLNPIFYTLFLYPGADHNLQPNSHWSQAIQRDLDFYQSFRQLSSKTPLSLL